MLTEEILTVNEVAEYLKINPQTVYRKAKAGQMPAVRIGRAIRFRKAELNEWLENLSTITPETEETVEALSV